MDCGQGPVRSDWPLFGGIGAHEGCLTVNDETPRCRSNYLGIGKDGILLYLQVAIGKLRLLAADGGRLDRAWDFPPNKGGDAPRAKRSTSERQPGTASRAG